MNAAISAAVSTEGVALGARRVASQRDEPPRGCELPRLDSNQEPAG